jgi:catechol 2,3-dioxygenase-like lactoylglutathione lyase family enzyme
MSTSVRTNDANLKGLDMKLEVAIIPVSNVDRSTEFYKSLGWRQDVTPPGIVQFTPHGSACSVQFGQDLTSAVPGSAKEYLVVSDIERTRDTLVAAGVPVGEVYHLGPDGQGPGLDPEHRSYLSVASFNDPDGNNWVLQEITTRLPGRVVGETTYTSTGDLMQALWRAATAHGEHEKRTGAADPNWPEWYAAYMVAERAGSPLPT